MHFSKVNVVVRLSVCSSAREEEAKCIARPPAPGRPSGTGRPPSSSRRCRPLSSGSYPSRRRFSLMLRKRTSTSFGLSLICGTAGSLGRSVGRPVGRRPRVLTPNVKLRRRDSCRGGGRDGCGGGRLQAGCCSWSRAVPFAPPPKTPNRFEKSNQRQSFFLPFFLPAAKHAGL